MNIEDAQPLPGHFDAIFRDVLCNLITHWPSLVDRPRSIARLELILRMVCCLSMFFRDMSFAH
jgi:hypothetical protein